MEKKCIPAERYKNASSVCDSQADYSAKKNVSNIPCSIKKVFFQLHLQYY